MQAAARAAALQCCPESSGGYSISTYRCKKRHSVLHFCINA